METDNIINIDNVIVPQKAPIKNTTQDNQNTLQDHIQYL